MVDDTAWCDRHRRFEIIKFLDNGIIEFECGMQLRPHRQWVDKGNGLFVAERINEHNKKAKN